MNKIGKDEQDEHLRQLALLAQQYPPLTSKRQIALTSLVQEIMKSRRLCHPYRYQFTSRYEEIYEEALQELLFYICQHIDKYNPERGSVMAWCNVLLERRFFKEAIPKILDKQSVQRMTLSELDNIVSPEEPPILTEILEEYIVLDPENLFRKEHIKNYPQTNFQALARQRISGKSWKEISAESGLKIATVSSFYYRCLNKFSERIKAYCIEHGV